MKIVLLAMLAVWFGFAAPVHAQGTAPKPPTLKLLDAGKDPKTTLRLVAKKGHKRTMIVSVGMSIATKAGGQDNKVTVPPLEMAMDLKVADVAANGDLTIDLTFGAMTLKSDASTPPVMIDAFKKIAKAVKGTKGRMRMTSRAFTQEVSLDIPASMPKEAADVMTSLKQTLSQISAPLPEEAVGLGAKWETSMLVTDSNGIDLEQVASNEVTAIKGKQTTLKVVVTQSAKPKKVTIKGMSFDLKSVKGGGSGDFVYDSTAFIPVGGTMVVSTTVTLASEGMPIETSVDMKLLLKTR